MGDFLRDLKAAWRALAHERSFSFIAISTLALESPAPPSFSRSSTAFCCVRSSYRDPGRLVLISEIVPELSQLYPRLPVNPRHFDQWRKTSRSFLLLSTITPGSQILSRAGAPRNRDCRSVRLFTSMAIPRCSPAICRRVAPRRSIRYKPCDTSKCQASKAILPWPRQTWAAQEPTPADRSRTPT